MDMDLLYAIIPIILVAIILVLIKFKDFSLGTILGAVIAIILVACLLAPAVSMDITPTTTNHLPDTIYYDDYIEVDGEPRVSGVFEYVMYNGQGYVHATDVGIGKIGSRSYTVQPAPLDVYLFLGQSNAANWAGVNAPTADPVAHLGTAYYFGTISHQSNKNLGVSISAYDMRSMVTTSGSARIGGTDEPFGAEYSELTGHKIYVINGAIGGTSVTTWVPEGTSYEYAQELFEAAWSEIDLTRFTPELKSYIWIQGESDATMAVATYESYFLSMHETLIDGTFTDVGSFEYALISLTQAVNPSIAQKELAEEYDTILIASELAQTFTVDNGYLISDGLHYSQSGRNLLGVALAEYAANLD